MKYYVSEGIQISRGAARGSDSEKFSALARLTWSIMNIWVLRPR